MNRKWKIAFTALAVYSVVLTVAVGSVTLFGIFESRIHSTMLIDFAANPSTYASDTSPEQQAALKHAISRMANIITEDTGPHARLNFAPAMTSFALFRENDNRLDGAEIDVLLEGFALCEKAYALYSQGPDR